MSGWFKPLTPLVGHDLNMNLGEIKHRPVVSLSDGTKLGEIDDLVLDPSCWVLIGYGVAGRSGHGLLPLTNLRSLGPDAAIVESPEAVTFGGNPPGLALSVLQDHHVVDASGTRLGHVAEVQYEPDGTIRSLEIRQGGVFGLGAHVVQVTPDHIRGVGDKIVTVDVSPAGA